MKENDTEKLSNSMFLNVVTRSFLVISPKLFREELLGFFQFRVVLYCTTIERMEINIVRHYYTKIAAK